MFATYFLIVLDRIEGDNYLREDGDVGCSIYSFVCLSGVWLTAIFMSHSLQWRRIVLLTVCAYSSNHRVLYTIELSMTRRFKKSVGPSVRLFVCNANKKSLLLLHYVSQFTVETYCIADGRCLFKQP